MHIAAVRAVTMYWTQSVLFAAEADQNSWTYLVKLHLQDATGEIDAALFDKDADEFFRVSALTH